MKIKNIWFFVVGLALFCIGFVGTSGYWLEQETLSYGAAFWFCLTGLGLIVLSFRAFRQLPINATKEEELEFVDLRSDETKWHEEQLRAADALTHVQKATQPINLQAEEARTERALGIIAQLERETTAVTRTGSATISKL